jgi:hypothetical protein
MDYTNLGIPSTSSIVQYSKKKTPFQKLELFLASGERMRDTSLLVLLERAGLSHQMIPDDGQSSEAE